LVAPAKKVQFAIADPDRVSEANISRQAFCHKEIGLPKAQAKRVEICYRLGSGRDGFRAGI
jgi:molybdopterin/thiamine biosynthesis adenylyltransferase